MNDFYTFHAKFILFFQPLFLPTRIITSCILANANSNENAGRDNFSTPVILINKRFHFKISLFILTIFANTFLFSQIPDFPTSQNINSQKVFEVPKIGTTPNNIHLPSVPTSWNNQSLSKVEEQNRRMIQEDFKRMEMEQEELAQKKKIEKLQEDYEATYFLTSLSDKEGTNAYYTAFENLSKLNPEDYSITNATFLVENAFYNNNKDFQNNYQSSIQKNAQILLKEISNQGIDFDDNVSKNLMLFQFFSKDTKQNGKVVHKAFKYDFDDYFGIKDYSKMFVSKLMKTNSGQCHSMPLLYLILAEQIGAEANLVMSPNHSYIRFQDDEGEMQSIELTAGMFSTDTFVLNSGFIKSEGLQSGIYMKNLTKSEILSQTFVDLASGYIHKYGYDEFVAKVLQKSLEINPNNVNAKAYKSNTDQTRFMQACERLGITPGKKEDFEKAKQHPALISQLNEINRGHEQIESAGYSTMTAEEYSSWLGSVKKEENKQRSEAIAEKMKAIQAQKKKEALKKTAPKKVQPKKETPKIYKIPKEFM